MVEIRPIDETDREAFRRLHNRYTDSDVGTDRMARWHEAAPTLCLGAYDGDCLVGHCLGIPDDETVELRGISVAESHRRHGLGSALLDAFETRVVDYGADRVTLGSAGGYVDTFYRANGYEARSVLVRNPDRTPPGYDILEERVEDGMRKLYVDPEGTDPEAAGEAFGDPEAIYIMEKRVGGR